MKSSIDAHNSTQLLVLSMMLNGASFLVFYFLINSGGIAESQVMVSSGAICSSCLTGSLLFGESFGIYKLLSVGFALAAIATMYLSVTEQSIPL